MFYRCPEITHDVSMWVIRCSNPIATGPTPAILFAIGFDLWTDSSLNQGNAVESPAPHKFVPMKVYRRGEPRCTVSALDAHKYRKMYVQVLRDQLMFI